MNTELQRLRKKVKKIRHKDFTLAKCNTLKAFEDFLSGKIVVPEQFMERPEDYKEFTVRSAIVGEISKLEKLVIIN